MVAAESSSGGQPIQSMLPAPYENPKSILKPINIDNVQDESIKKKIQARLHQFEVFKPSRDDTSKRFMTQRINKVCVRITLISSIFMHIQSWNKLFGQAQ